MQVSEARAAASRANGAKGRGPTSEQGRRKSAANSYQHGLTGQGIVLPDDDRVEIERRLQALEAHHDPQSPEGALLLRKFAIFSVRSEKAAARASAMTRQRVRNAVDDYDEERARRADDLFDQLFNHPKGALRNLRRMPEGVDLLLEAWRMLRFDLARQGDHRWGAPQMARACNLVGVLGMDAVTCRVGALSNALWGDPTLLAPHECAGLDNEGRKAWARQALLELVDGQVAELEAHRKTLDLGRIELDRQEAPLRATFDDSKEASLARRYEADSDRGMYKALKEFRQAEAEFAARNEPVPEPTLPDEPEPASGSFREESPPTPRARSLAFLEVPTVENPVVRGPDDLPLSISRPVSPPR